MQIQKKMKNENDTQYSRQQKSSKKVAKTPLQKVAKIRGLRWLDDRKINPPLKDLK